MPLRLNRPEWHRGTNDEKATAFPMKKRSLLILDLGWAGQAIGAFVAGSANKPTDEVGMDNTDSNTQPRNA